MLLAFRLDTTLTGSTPGTLQTLRSFLSTTFLVVFSKMSDTHDPTVNDIFADDDPPKRLNKGIRRMPLSNTSFPYIPSLARLCLAKVRALRSRLEGLSFLPEDIVISIVEGSTIDELKQIEIANPDAPALKFWDRFWQPRCEKSMV